MTQETVRDYATEHGYEIVESERDRYHKTLLRDGEEKLFLKLSTDPDRDGLLKNEAEWNRRVGGLAREDGRPFRFPEVRDEGKMDGRKYLVLEWYPRQRSFSRDPEMLGESIEKVIDFLFWLREIDVDLPNDSDPAFFRADRDIGEDVLERTESYEEEMGEEFPEMKEVIKSTELGGRSLAHAEVKPDHLFRLDGELGVIDAEWSSNLIPEHYDIVSCYARTYTRPGYTQVAEELLETYHRRCASEGLDTNRFASQFRGLLAWRAVGEYMDAQEAGKSVDRYLELTEKVAGNEFPYTE